MFITLSLTYSCQSHLHPNDGGYDADPYYNIYFNSEANPEGHTFEGVKTEWNLNSGILVLGPEDTGEPLARLQLTLSVGLDNYIRIVSGSLSTTDVRTGTSEELNAKLYTFVDYVDNGGHGIIPNEINSTNVKIDPYILITMERVIVNENDVPETISLGAKFNAVD